MAHPTFAPGQRWLSETEPELGLGVVAEVDHRTVTLEFRSSEQTRRYARQQAPLSRIVFGVGDTITAITGEELIVIEALEFDDTIIYHAHRVENAADTIKLPESLLSDTLVLSRPTERLFSGQIDAAQWFNVRRRTLEQLAEIQKSPVLGLCSGRTDLIPHQLYIASEVASRHAPRVMLADEVGLGKTIEAGLILQQQLANGLASRVLIIVPEPLLHQWLVEMLRRFNLHFSLYDEERCGELLEAMEGEEALRNPFLEEQLVLTGIEVFKRQPRWYEFAVDGEWDLCIIDEAHHLRDDAAFNADGLSDYARIRDIATSSKGVLLLTATPEQMGQENHFALLQLLDPNRFSDFEAYRQEQDNYRSLAGTINALTAADADGVTAAQLQQLEQVLAKNHGDKAIANLMRPLRESEDFSAGEQEAARDRLIRLLLDQHGTGRILFRNTRKALSGFPGRQLNVVTLPAQPQPAVQDEDSTALPWTSTDGRVKWLVDFLQEHRNEKVLLICAEDATAISLEKYLRVNAGIRSGVFHRHMNIVDRDRVAAYFAGTESSAQILVCSEIGSEGRNFQFCRHLVLFDLPLNPDLLEQRIGRLDRIGQRHTIQLHVPVFEHSGLQVLQRWYQDALNAFEQVAPAAWRVYQQFQETLQGFIAQGDAHSADFERFLAEAAQVNAALNRELEQGRDRLLEINSFNQQAATAILAQIHDFEERCTPEHYMKEVFDVFGVHYEHNSDGSYTLQPTEEMIAAFPALPDEGMGASFDRQLALHREDMHFLTWMHPMVSGAIDLVLDSPQGGAAVSLLDSRACAGSPLTRQDFLIEAIYRTVAPAPRHLQMPRFLPATHFHLVLGPSVEDAWVEQEPNNDHTHTQALRQALEQNRDALHFIDRHDAARLVGEQQSRIVETLQRAEALARSQMNAVIEKALSTMLQVQTGEIRRLVALKQVNPNVREEELEYLKEQTLQLHDSLKQASLELAAVHVIFRAG